MKKFLEATSKRGKFPCSSASQVSIIIPSDHIHWPKQHQGQAYSKASWSDLELRWEGLSKAVCTSRLTFGPITVVYPVWLHQARIACSHWAVCVLRTTGNVIQHIYNWLQYHVTMLKDWTTLKRTHMSLGLFLSQISLWMHIFLITLNAILVPKLTSAPGSTSLASQPEGKTISLLSSILRLAGRRGWLMKGQMHALRLSKWATVIGSSHWTSWFRQLVERGVWESPL